MSLFKAKILSQYIQDEQVIEQRYALLQAYQKKAEDIKNFREEQYQTGFLEEIFEQCLGYTLKIHNPKNYNLEREKKNETDSKKADAVIYNSHGEVIAVIELKDQKTQDLSKAVEQAFNYHNNHKTSKYIIISNFNELRFYIDKKTDYEKFDLFTMDKDEFRCFYLILNYQSIVSDLPIEIKQKSDKADADISKKLYADFADFRLALFDNAKQNNPNISQKKLLRLIQKLCDRIIFILFAEDKGLLKPNTIAEIESKHNSIKGIADISLYQFYQKYFQAIDKGNTDLGIMPYNGGLFADDIELNQLTISDNILEQYLPKLSAYDFKSDISVNILGHIFEQSLSDLEELNAAIDNQQFDYNQSKRKKDGIFYTPEYITQFIVEQTLGKICEDKKAELGLNGEIRLPEKMKKKLNQEEQNLLDRLYQYRNFLLELKIIDPACGSGAFLNQALEFLIREHHFIDKHRRILENESLGLYDIEISILENNLYGVDINADAVEIAKLSLWLRTAQKGRKLTDLSNNIICANSLLALPIQDSTAVGWASQPTTTPTALVKKNIFRQPETDNIAPNGATTTFPQKFDCVIGNPPYVRQEMIKDQKPALQQRYSVYTGTADLFVYFYELGINLLKDNGLLGFICSNKFFRASYGEKLRQFILENTKIQAVADFNGIKVFEDATVDSAITVLQKHAPNDNVVELATQPTAKPQGLNTTKTTPDGVAVGKDAHPTAEQYFRYYAPDLHNYQTLSQNALTPSGFIFLSPIESGLKAKIEAIGTPLKDWDISIYRGILTGLNDAFIIDEETRQNILCTCLNEEERERTAALIKPILRGRDIKRYAYEWAGLYIIGTFPALHLNIDDYPSLKNYLSQFLPQIEQSGEKGCRKKTANKWFETQDNIAYWQDFNKEKIIWAEIARTGNAFAFDNSKIYTNDKCFILTNNDKSQNIHYLLSCLNSPLSLFYLEQVYTKFDTTGWQWKKVAVEQIPIPKIIQENQNIAEKIIQLSVELSEKTNALNIAIKNFLQELQLEKIPQKLQNFDALDFDAFIKEYAKALKIKFADKLEERNFKQQWQRLFETDKQSVAKLKTQIKTTNTAINQMVYQLYNLTDEEIKIVEQA